MPVPKSFKSAQIPSPKAESIVADRSLAPLKDGEVGIRITATAINPVDWKIRDYAVIIQEYPAVLGSDAAGEVVEVGKGVENLKEGDRVFFQGVIGDYDASTFQQYCKMDAKLVGKTPKNITDDQAAGITLTTIAGLTALYDQSGFDLRPYPWAEGGDKAGEGKAIVIIGGSSAVGQNAIQLARLAGYSKIITNASAHHLDHLKTLGATAVLDRSQSSHKDFVEAIGDTVLAVVFDSIAHPDTVLECVKTVQAAQKIDDKTKVVHINPGFQSDDVDKQCQQGRKVEVKGVFGSGFKLRHLSEPLMQWIGGEDGLYAKGKWEPLKPLVIPGGLGGVEEALQKNKKGVSGEKVVVRPFD